MGKVSIGINLEFVRSQDKSFEWGAEKAAELGFEYIEPMVHWGRELLSAAGYFHSISMLDDPFRITNACKKYGLKVSALSAHSPLCKPEISTEYLKQAVRFAAECKAPVICTDDGPKPSWTTEEEDHVLMKYVLHEAASMAESRGVFIGLETHAQYTNSPEKLSRVLNLTNSSAIGINLDTGNSYLSNNDPHEWLEKIIDKVVLIHAKDISKKDAENYRGKVWGMLGCACGEGVIDWERIIATCNKAPRDLVLSIECGTVEDAAKSLQYLKPIVERINQQ